MNTTVMWVLVGIVAAGGIALLIVTALRREKNRSRALAAVAQELGRLSLMNGDGKPRLDALRIATNLFTQEGGGTAYNAMEGTVAGLRVILFDYRYVSGSGDSIATVHQTVATFATAKNNLPKFVLKKKGMSCGFLRRRLRSTATPSSHGASLLPTQMPARRQRFLAQPSPEL
jgi:hypothetical protein